VLGQASFVTGQALTPDGRFTARRRLAM